MTRARQAVSALDYLTTYGVTDAVRKAVRVYLHGRRQNYLGRVDHAAGTRLPFPRGGLDFRPASPDDIPRLVARFHGRATPASVFRRWLRPPYLLLLAVDGAQPVAYQCLSTVAGPSLKPVLPLRAEQLFSGEVFTLPSLRGQGVVGQLMIAASHLLLERGFRERWFTIDRLNHVSEGAFFRGQHATDRVGTLTRTGRFGRVRFSFAPATPLSPHRIARLISLLTDLRGPVSRVAVLMNPASLTVDPRLAEAATHAMAPDGIEVRPVAVRASADPASTLRQTMREIGATRVDGVIVLSDPMLADHRGIITAGATACRLTAAYEGARFAAAGGLVACRPPVAPLNDLPAPLHRLGLAAGEGPELVINLRTARALGLSVPPSLRLRAEELIE